MSFNGPLSNPVVEPTASSTAHHCVSLSTFVKRMVDTLTRDFDSSTIYRVDFSNMVSLIRVTRKRRLAANNGLMKWLGSNPDFLVGAVGLGRITDRGPPLVHKYTSHMLCYDSSEAMENAIKCMQQRPQIVTRRIQFTIHVKKGLQVKYATTKTAFKTKLQPLQFGERLGLQQASIHCCERYGLSAETLNQGLVEGFCASSVRDWWCEGLGIGSAGESGSSGKSKPNNEMSLTSLGDALREIAEEEEEENAWVDVTTAFAAARISD